MYTLSKTVKIHERFAVKASISAFNILNVTSYASTSTSVNSPGGFGRSGGQPNDGNPVNGTGGAREVLLGMKLSF